MATPKKSSPQWGRACSGVAFLALCLFFVWFTYAVFSKQFASYDEVVLRTSKIGLSMPSRADVKIRGVIVGEVLETRTDGDGAEMVLGLYPEETDTIPADVEAQILPKTLFGEKYVSLQVPESGGSGTIAAGDVIEQSEIAIELEEVINDLFPLLRTVQPTELNYTLTAIANALEGRGDALGENLETLDSYLRRMNPEIPALVESLRQLGEVSGVYESVVPDLTRMLRNTVTTTQTFESKEDEIQALFDDVAGFSGTAEEFLKTNGDNMVTLADQGRQILPVLAKHSPAFECFLAGAVASIHPNEEAFRDKTLHIILETLPRQPRGYNPGGPAGVQRQAGRLPVLRGDVQGRPRRVRPGQPDPAPAGAADQGRRRVPDPQAGDRGQPGDRHPGAPGGARPRRGRGPGRAGRRGARAGLAAARADGAGEGGGRPMILGLDKKTAGDGVRLIIFIVVTTLSTALLAVTIGNISFGSKKDYKAVFSDATGVVQGDDIRIAGVKVGTVNDVEIINRTQAVVEFSVEDETRLTESTYATVRYRNLVGQRYIALTEGAGSPGVLREGSTIPLDRTTPALDLTVLFNGFKPLFAAMSPADVNKLAFELIQVFQGEGGTLEGLLDRTASVTTTLAARDELIGDLIANLNETLVTVGDRDEQLSDLIIQLRRFISGLSKDRQAILGLAGLDLRAGGGDLRPGDRHPPRPDQGRHRAAQGHRQPAPQRARARPGDQGAADQAREGGPHRDLRLVVQLLPVRLHRTGPSARRDRPPGQVRHQRVEV